MAPRIKNPCVAMISDLHVGDPENRRLEDFDRDLAFEHLLLKDLPGAAKDRKTTLVIAGDFIDFPQILPELGRSSPEERLGTTEAESKRRIERAIAGHKRVFDAMKGFLDAGNQILVLPGNHDVDLHFESVFAALREAAGGAGEPSLSFVREGTLNESRIFIEHGNQYSYDNWFEFWDAPIRIAKDGTSRIERPWGTLFMDIVYNDIEDAYPFVNKIYPHDKLAGIVLRLMRDDTRVAVHVLARLVAFFTSRGKRALAGWALGKEDEGAESAVTPASIAAFVETFGEGMGEARKSALITETVTLTGAKEGEAMDAAPEIDAEAHGLLGRTDERGLDKRARDLLRTGRIDVVAFGHTHEPFEKNVELPGRVGKIVNTGSWIPRIEVTGEGAPSLAAIAKIPVKHELKCLWIELGGAPRAELVSLPDLG